jgi:hypothetical protein
MLTGKGINFDLRGTGRGVTVQYYDICGQVDEARCCIGLWNFLTSQVDDHIDGARLRLWTAVTKGPIVHPRAIYEPREPWWNYIDRGNSWFVRQSSLATLQEESSSSKAGGTDNGNYEFGLTKYLCSYFQKILTCLKILRHGADGFTFPPKEVVLRILLPLEMCRPRAGLNPRTLGPIASTLSNTPTRMTSRVAFHPSKVPRKTHIYRSLVL